MQLTKKQTEVIEAKGHTLITGGPGSGKTTIAILKARKSAESNLMAEQKVLFLSFARATVSRIIDAINEQKTQEKTKEKIVVETYHSFFWRVLRTHGYLIGLPRRPEILTRADESVALSKIRSMCTTESKLTSTKEKKETAECKRLACENGRICFDLFAPYVGDILHGSKRIRSLLAIMYPVVIFDEFQDTNADQWRVVQAMGEFSNLLVLSDPEQRIYDFIGADPERLNHFRDVFTPTEIDLGIDNHRSGNTEIVTFGDDILSGKLRKEKYNGIDCILYKPRAKEKVLVKTVQAAQKRLVDAGQKDWSLAILVPTKKMVRLVSNILHMPPAGEDKIPHTSVIESEAIILAAKTISFLMQPDAVGNHFSQFIRLVCDYFKGKGGDAPSKSNLKEASNLKKSYCKWLVCRAEKRVIKKNSILVRMKIVYDKARALALTGNPNDDWREIINILENGMCSRLKNIAEEVRNIDLLESWGAVLRQDLSRDWIDNGAYKNSLSITQHIFEKKYFSTDTKENGVVVMNMHKAKGKQFCEVIIFEGHPHSKNGQIVANPNRIVRSNNRAEINKQTRQNLRVSVTRAKKRTTILTPENDPCVLLPIAR